MSFQAQVLQQLGILQSFVQSLQSSVKNLVSFSLTTDLNGLDYLHFSQNGVDKKGSLTTLLAYISANISTSSSGLQTSDKEIITLTEATNTIQLTDSPDTIELHEQTGYLIENGFYTYSGGIITTTEILPVDTVLSVLKLYGSNRKQTFVVQANQTTFQIIGNPKNIDVHEEGGYRIEGTFYTYNNTTGVMTTSLQLQVDTNLHITKHY